MHAIKHGYAFVEMNERGHFFSEGNYDILGPPLTDGTDAITWMSSQPWSNGKVGTIGCSSTAEWQLGVAAQGNPAFAAMIPQGFGAGVGRVGPYYEQGNWYRGGAVQMLFIAWLYGEQNQVRPMFPPNTSQEDLIRASKSFDLAQQLPPVDWAKALQHLPEMDILKAVDGPHGIFADRMEVATGGAMIKRTPNDPAWYRGGLWHDDHAHQRARILVHVVVRRVHRAEPGGLQLRAQDGRARKSRNSNTRSSRRRDTAAISAPPKTRSSASAAWATRGWTTTRSRTGGSTFS